MTKRELMERGKGSGGRQGVRRKCVILKIKIKKRRNAFKPEFLQGSEMGGHKEMWAISAFLG